MLFFYFLNVGHGSSTVIEYRTDGGSHFGVIDSRTKARARPRALDKLDELGATSLSFLALTHPHDDHYSGMYEIMRGTPQIHDFYTFPMGRLVENRERFAKYQKQLVQLLTRTDSMEVREARRELVQVMRWADDSHRRRTTIWNECDGEENIIAPHGFKGVNVATILPPKASKGKWIEKLSKGELDVVGDLDENELSLAFRVRYGGVEVILGGDGNKANWLIREKHQQRLGQVPSAQVVSLPHHGSAIDCDPSVMTRLFSPHGRRLGITSADGHSHPSPDTIRWMSQQGIAPYCTNLMSVCGANVAELGSIPGLDKELSRWLREVAARTHKVQVCQGDITLRIEQTGNYEITSETGIPCWFRGDYEKLAAVATT